MSGGQEAIVQALYDFDYETAEGKKVFLREGEELQLLKKTNGDWWQVMRNGEKRPFYAPANYVEEMSATNGIKSNRRSRLSTSTSVDSGSDVNSNGSVCVSLSSLDTVVPTTNSTSNTNSSCENKVLVSPPSTLPPPLPVKDFTKIGNGNGNPKMFTSVHRAKKLPPKSNSIKPARPQLIKQSISETSIPTLESTCPKITLSSVSPKSSLTIEHCKPLGRSNHRYSNKEAIDISLNAIRENEADGELEKVSRLLKEDRRNNNNNGSCLSNDNNDNAGNHEECNNCPRVSVSGNDGGNCEEIAPTIPQDKVTKKMVPKPLRPRPPSPVYANFPLISSPNPPSPQIPRLPLRYFDNGWAEFVDPTGRRFYYNIATEEKSWKPPRKISNGEHKSSSVNSNKELNRYSNGSLSDSGSSQEQLLHCPTPTSISMPPGWTKSSDSTSGETCFINDSNKERWFTSADDRGRIYYYKENGVESFWQLPDIAVENCQKNHSGLSSSTTLTTSSPSLLEGHVKHRPVSPNSPTNSVTPRRRPLSMADRNNKTRSMVINIEPRFIVNEDLRDSRSSTLPKSLTTQNIARLPDEVLRGMLFKTKLSEGGKKLRKNWTVSHTVLTDQSLYFFKDLKPTEINPSKAELRIDLLGATIDWAPEKSSRKNAFQVSTITGTDLQILLQEEDAFYAKRWFEAINSSIKKLPSGFEIATMKLGDGTIDEAKKYHSINRRTLPKKTDKKGFGSSIEDLDCTPIEKKSKIRDKLRNFFVRRPTLESLREKGIIKEEPVFGCNLQTLCNRDKVHIPKFVQRCIAAIEERDINADGLYRASGNLSQVQRIRFQINQDNWNVLNDEEDIHVLTGALKMFFRELKEPLFPIDTFGKFLSAIALPDRKGKLQAFQSLLESFPEENYCTLKYLLEHLLRVTDYSDQNRMHIQNLAIVFGPTLMWSSTDPISIALDVIHQNQIIEFLLLEFGAIFR